MLITVINGANINQLGEEPIQINGSINLSQIEQNLRQLSNDLQIELEFFHSNIEGEIINKIHNCRSRSQGILINAGSYSQTSVAISEALRSVMIPCVEVILGNVTMNDKIKTLISPSCIGLITGFGPFSYHLGLISLHNTIEQFIAQQKQLQEQQNNK